MTTTVPVSSATIFSALLCAHLSSHSPANAPFLSLDNLFVFFFSGVNNCIGRRNYRFFFFFLISLSIHMLSIFSLCLIYVLKHKDKLAQVEAIVALVLMAIVILLAIPIFGLTGFHMVLVSRGRTTNEQVTGKFKGGYNPFSRGCWNNCCYAQCGPQYPSLLKPHKYVVKLAPCEIAPISTILPAEPNINSPHTVNVLHNQVSSLLIVICHLPFFCCCFCCCR